MPAFYIYIYDKIRYDFSMHIKLYDRIHTRYKFLPAGLIIRVPSEDATHTSENTVPKACNPQSDMALGIYICVSI